MLLINESSLYPDDASLLSVPWWKRIQVILVSSVYPGWSMFRLAFLRGFWRPCSTFFPVCGVIYKHGKDSGFNWTQDTWSSQHWLRQTLKVLICHSVHYGERSADVRKTVHGTHHIRDPHPTCSEDSPKEAPSWSQKKTLTWGGQVCARNRGETWTSIYECRVKSGEDQARCWAPVTLYPSGEKDHKLPEDICHSDPLTWTCELRQGFSPLSCAYHSSTRNNARMFWSSQNRHQGKIKDWWDRGRQTITLWGIWPRYPTLHCTRTHWLFQASNFNINFWIKTNFLPQSLILLLKKKVLT